MVMVIVKENLKMKEIKIIYIKTRTHTIIRWHLNKFIKKDNCKYETQKINRKTINQKF